MSQWLGMWTAFAEDFSSIPSTYGGQLTTPVPAGSNPSVFHRHLPSHTHTKRQAAIIKLLKTV